MCSERGVLAAPLSSRLVIAPSGQKQVLQQVSQEAGMTPSAAQCSLSEHFYCMRSRREDTWKTPANPSQNPLRRAAYIFDAIDVPEAIVNNPVTAQATDLKFKRHFLKVFTF